MKTQDIQIIHQEDFYDDYEENVMSDYQRNIEDILYEVITLSEEIPESYQYIFVEAERCIDNIAKRFTFTSYETEIGLEVQYMGVIDE